MTDNIAYDLDELDDLATQLHNLATFITEHLDTLDANVAAVHTGGAWDGAAADAHHDAHAKWAVAAREFNTGIESMRDAVRNAHTQYAGALTANTSMLKL
ncbi:WXG100 family type VII secretion target [Nocardia stercoris]|uniref:ESAT-6-like protein n=1 Tax=Nocardia stercoris TaxID=2483361 RepID=A0A3M2KW82_9NOCA|nr:WXG100 family type VII secretion target [Nocardia stercoris]RMI29852.1 WXG100 family type VII secretion target [Nocardia stercoris]